MKKIIQKLFAANLYLQMRDEHGKVRITLVHKKSFHSVSNKVAVDVFDKMFDKVVDSMIKRFELQNATKPSKPVIHVATAEQIKRQKKIAKSPVVKELMKRIDAKVKAARRDKRKKVK